MSIHHEVSVHCDVCSYWEWGSQHTTAQRRAAGWTIWREDHGRRSFRHTCPDCTKLAQRVHEGNTGMIWDEVVEYVRRGLRYQGPTSFFVDEDKTNR